LRRVRHARCWAGARGALPGGNAAVEACQSGVLDPATAIGVDRLGSPDAVGRGRVCAIPDGNAVLHHEMEMITRCSWRDS